MLRLTGASNGRSAVIYDENQWQDHPDYDPAQREQQKTLALLIDDTVASYIEDEETTLTGDQVFVALASFVGAHINGECDEPEAAHFYELSIAQFVHLLQRYLGVAPP